ncbi:hypothetical protein EGR_09446 [Echinococcus granulosus]|uniref:Uncharacterized protein n=1 Tax=Echinococcus granulosus TaxID=6210 RepID=W6U559_ECHGR|nr:hypothetical protein EGR_09446 [Echinococcus granulosus]EUB55686.1 hypothetical protein EGR_09446 [Echinococcus granulosus]
MRDIQSRPVLLRFQKEKNCLQGVESAFIFYKGLYFLNSSEYHPSLGCHKSFLNFAHFMNTKLIFHTFIKLKEHFFHGTKSFESKALLTSTNQFVAKMSTSNDRIDSSEEVDTHEVFLVYIHEKRENNDPPKFKQKQMVTNKSGWATNFLLSAPASLKKFCFLKFDLQQLFKF